MLLAARTLGSNTKNSGADSEGRGQARTLAGLVDKGQDRRRVDQASRSEMGQPHIEHGAAPLLDDHPQTLSDRDLDVSRTLR
jgi:hypothetical protein